MLKQVNNALIQAQMRYSVNIIRSLFYLSRKDSPWHMFLLFSCCLFVFQDSLCTLFYYVLFVFLDFPVTLLLDIFFILLDFHDTYLSHITIALHDFPHIFLFYIILWIPFQCHICFELPAFSFMVHTDIFFFQDSDFSANLLAIAPFFINI